MKRPSLPSRLPARWPRALGLALLVSGSLLAAVSHNRLKRAQDFHAAARAAALAPPLPPALRRRLQTAHGQWVLAEQPATFPAAYHLRLAETRVEALRPLLQALHDEAGLTPLTCTFWPRPAGLTAQCALHAMPVGEPR